MLRPLITICYFFIIGHIVYLLLYIERLKKKIVRNISEKAGREVLEEIILEDKRKSGISEEGLRRIKDGLGKLDSSKLEKRIINEILTKLDLMTMVKRTIVVRLGLLPAMIVGWIWRKDLEFKSVSFIEDLNLEKIIKDPGILENLKSIDKDREKKERFHVNLILIALLILLVSIVLDVYRTFAEFPNF